jgi:hypothetical protein
MSPSNQVLLTDARILALADEEMSNEIVPLLDSLNEDFFVTVEEETTVADQQEYDIPYRAIGRKLRDLKIKKGTVIRSLPYINVENEHIYSTFSEPTAHNFRADKIYLHPKPTNDDYTLQKFFLLRPSKMVKTTDAGCITNISGSDITVSSVPSTFVAGATIDFVQGRSGYQTISMDKTITNVSGLVITVSSVPSSLQNYDFISIAEETPVVQIPDEIFSYLVQRTSKRCLEALGDFDSAKIVEGRLLQAKRNAQMLMSPRNEGASKKIIQRNGLIRGNRTIRYFRGNLS